MAEGVLFQHLLAIDDQPHRLADPDVEERRLRSTRIVKGVQPPPSEMRICLEADWTAAMDDAESRSMTSAWPLESALSWLFSSA